ncbi:alpha/beta fold hydrolase [Nonlabens antarcticus]|uniref:alpha/beta fold hydrolase n=1 Tax=Nonlabens antarcticus TaxID=392714 RepID=UPI001891DF46|nr:alpha/beta hydrolase [Nonlabens antarcticus]
MKTISKILFTIFIACTAISNAQNNPIEVTVTGDGAPIILLSGFATNGNEVWQTTVDELSKTHKCHVINYAGFAGMKPIEFPWLPKVLTNIEDYIKEKQLKKPVIIGHSLGGTLGIKLASNPDLNISRLLIVDALPATGALLFPDFKPETLQYESPYNQQMLGMDEAAFAQMAMGMAAGMTSNTIGQEQIIKWMKTTDRKTFVYAYTDYLKFDMREGLKQINIPVTILGAGKPYGEEMAKANYTKQYQNLSDYNLVMNADSAHFIMMDQPKWFMEQLNLFLK